MWARWISWETLSSWIRNRTSPFQNDGRLIATRRPRAFLANRKALSQNWQMPKRPKTAACVKKLKVLADNARLSVLDLLMSGPKRVWEINEVLGIEQSLLSHHLKALRQAGLVETRRDGKAILYRVSRQLGATRSRKALDLGCCVLSFEKN